MFISRVPVLAISLRQSVGGDLVPFSWLSLPSQLCGRLALTPPHALLHLFCCGCSHTPGLPTLPSCSSLSGCPCVRVFATLVPQSLAMVCFPIRGTETCALDAVGSSGRGALVAEGRSRRRGVVRSSLVLLPPAIRGMPWTHRGRAVGPVPDPRPMAGVPGASMPSWKGQPTAAPFLLFHNFPGSVCADEPGLPAPGHGQAWLWGRGAARGPCGLHLCSAGELSPPSSAPSV